MAVEIREYVESDMPALAVCMTGLQKHLAEIDPLHREILPEHYGENYLKKVLLPILKEHESKLFVATDEDIVIGVVVGTFEPAPKDPGVVSSKTGCVRELYVDENYRGQGIGKKLMGVIESYFKVMGCEGVTLEVFTPNQLAREFYASNGYIEREIKLLKLLS